MNKEFFYQRQISNYAEINNYDFNQYNETITTKNLKVIGLLETDTGNNIVQLFSPFVQRSTTVSKNPSSGAVLVYGGTSIQNGNINVLGQKNPINFFQSTVKANSLIAFEGMNIKKDFLTYDLETQSDTSVVDLKGTINNNQSIPTDISKLISLSDVYINNELNGDGLFTIHNIHISNIINPAIIYTKNNLTFSNITAQEIYIQNIETDNIITNELHISVFDNKDGNIDGTIFNIGDILDYQNIQTNLLIVEENMTEIKNIPYANITTSTDISGEIINNDYNTDILNITNFANLVGTTTVGNLITTQILVIENLSTTNLIITSGTESSTFEHINHEGDVVIYNKFNISGNTYSGNVENISYYDNMIPINLGDNNQFRDSGYQYNYIEGNVGIIFRKKPINDIIVGNVGNVFIIGRFNYNDPIFPTIELLNVYANAIYGSTISNTLALGITNNVFIGNTSYNNYIYGNIYTNNAILSNITINQLISSTLFTNKNIQGNILFSNYLEGNVYVPNIDPNSLFYSGLTSNLILSNIINLSGNLITNSTLILTNSNMIINSLTASNLIVNNNIQSNNIYNSNNLIAGNIISNITNTSRTTVYGNINYGNLYVSVNQVTGNTEFDDYEISKIYNNKYIQGNLYKTNIGDTQIFDQYYRKSYNTTLLNNNNNITLSTNNPLLKTIYNDKFIIMKNKYASYNFNPYNNIQNIQLNEHINHITSSYNGEVLGIDTLGNNHIYRLNYSTYQYNLIQTIPKTSILLNTKTIDLNIDGNTIIIGDPLFNNQSGNITVYLYNGTQYILNNYINGNSNDRLGYNVGISSNRLIGSAPENGTYGGGGSNNGNVYIYDNNLTLQQTIRSIISDKQFGKNISLTNKNIAIADNNNVYTFNNTTLIGNLNITGNINSIDLDGSNNFLIINGNTNTVYKFRTNIIVFSSNNTLYRGSAFIVGDGSYLYNLYDGYLMKHININSNYMIENIYDLGIRGNNLINVSKNGNYMYIGNNNGIVGNVYVYN
jgi:hypothetical protein